jgi:hypothetical protein
MNFNVSKTEGDQIHAIVARTEYELGRRVDRLGLTMDITACHANGNPLDLDGLLKAKTADFLHDVLGITAKIDRTTGHLTHCFSPRHSARKEAA